LSTGLYSKNWRKNFRPLCWNIGLLKCANDCLTFSIANWLT